MGIATERKQARHRGGSGRARRFWLRARILVGDAPPAGIYPCSRAGGASPHEFVWIRQILHGVASFLGGGLAGGFGPCRPFSSLVSPKRVHIAPCGESVDSGVMVLTRTFPQRTRASRLYVRCLLQPTAAGEVPRRNLRVTEECGLLAVRRHRPANVKYSSHSDFMAALRGVGGHRR